MEECFSLARNSRVVLKQWMDPWPEQTNPTNRELSLSTLAATSRCVQGSYNWTSRKLLASMFLSSTERRSWKKEVNNLPIYIIILELFKKSVGSDDLNYSFKHVAIMSTSSRRLSCAKCDILQPENGKILSCFHIICPGCTTDLLNPESNCIKCSLCGDVTEPHVNGIPLVEQLASCEPSLYNSADTTAQLIAAATGGGQERRLCDLYDEGSEGDATHSCERCNGMLLCAEHTENHSRRRAFSGHVVKLLGANHCTCKVSTCGPESARCFFNKNNSVITV